MSQVWLFAYGTLTRRGRMQALTGRQLPETVPGWLRGYRKEDTAHGYPIIVEDAAPGAMVAGVLWSVDDADLPAIDHYEGTDEEPPYYFRRHVEVEVDGQRRAAQVYVGNPQAFWPQGRPGV